MKKKRFAMVLVCFLVFLQSGDAQPSSEQAKKLKVAAVWLHNLCLIPGDDLVSLPSNELVSRLDNWKRVGSSALSCELEKPSRAPAVPQVDVDTLSPNWIERIGRTLEFRTNIQQTPSYVFGVKEGSPANTPSAFLPNSDHSIFSFGGPIHLDELFIPADTRVAMCTALRAYQQADDHRCWNERFLMADRIVDHLARIASTMSLDLKFSQVPKFQSGVLASSQSNNPFPKWSNTITGSFDPAKLFRSMAEIKALSAFAETSAALKKDVDLLDFCEHTDDQLVTDPYDTTDCINAIVMGRKSRRIALSLTPHIDVTSTTPFDLAKYGTAFIAPPNKAGRSVYSVALSWNLRNLIPSAASRADALKIVSEAYNSMQHDDEEATWRLQVENCYLEILVMPERVLDPVWWQDFERLLLRVKRGSKQPMTEELGSISSR